MSVLLSYDCQKVNSVVVNDIIYTEVSKIHVQVFQVIGMEVEISSSLSLQRGSGN